MGALARELANRPSKWSGAVFSTFQIAESMGFKGEFRQWEDLLRVAE